MERRCGRGVRKKPSKMWAIQQETLHSIRYFMGNDDETLQRINVDMKIQWNLDLSFLQQSFSRMYCSQFLVPNEVPYK